MDVFGPGLGDSQRTLLELLKRQGPATLSDLESGLELARETLRDHLKALAARGLVERSGVRREGRGRPEVVYRLSDTAETLFPQREAQLLGDLATFLIEEGEAELLERFLTARAVGKREHLLERVAGLEGRTRLDEVASILSEEGFLADVQEPSEGRPRLRLCHCPMRSLVEVSKLPCQAEMGLVQELLGETLHRESFIPDGDSSCTYVLGALRPTPKN